MTETALPAGSPEPPPIPASVRPTPRWRWLIHLLILGVYPMLGLLFRANSDRLQQAPALSGNVRGLLFVSGVELLVFSIFFVAAC